MTIIANWRRYLRFWGPDLDADIAEEFRFHLETEIEELVAKGMTPDAARADALRRFGDVAYYRQYCRRADARRAAREHRARVLDVLRQDVRYTLRTLLRQPAFTAAAVLTLGIGIGANTAMFSVVHAVVLSPLPYRDPQRLVMLWESTRDAPEITVSYPDYLDWRARARSFLDIAIYNGFGSFNLTGVGDPEPVHGGLASANLFPLLGVRAAIGRVFGAGDDRPGATATVLVGHKLWQRRFAGDPAIVGRPVMLDGGSYVVIGVLPPTFELAGSELWLPIGLFTNTPRFVRNNHPGLLAIARMKPGITIQQMRSDLGAVARQLQTEYPKESAGIGASGAPLAEIVVGQIKPALLMLTAAVALVLLVACANVANLQLGRAAARRREFGLRVAIGAGRGRLVRQLLTESVLLALIGSALGVALASAGIRLLVALEPRNIPRLSAIRVDASVLAFALATSVVTGILFGLVPALHSSRGNPIDALKETGRGASGGRSRNRVRATLTVAEVALALVLLVGAGLLVRSFTNLLAVDPGFDRRRVIAARVQLPVQRYPDDERRQVILEDLLGKVRALPQVNEVVLSSDLPIMSGWQTTLTFEGATTSSAQSEPLLNAAAVTPGYFHAMRIATLAGRDFTTQDRKGQPLVTVVTEAAAKRFFGSINAVGRRLKQGHIGSASPWITIVGVVRDVKNDGLQRLSAGTVYFPTGQSDEQSMWLIVRSDAPLESLAPLLRRELASIDPELPLASLQTLEQAVDATIAQPKFSALMLGIFAAIALALAAIGIYGVISYSVAQRTREIGVRIALGAQRADVLRMVVGQGMTLAALGIAIGAVAAAGTTRLIAGHLFGVKPADPAVFVSVALTLAAVAFAATALPAMRATRVDPTDALRGE